MTDKEKKEPDVIVQGPLPKDQAALLELLSPLISEYLGIMKIPLSIEQYLKELAVAPIRIDNLLIGFWGVRIRGAGERKLATVKAFYIREKYRGRYLNRAADDFVRGLSQQGVTEIEVWADSEVQKWLTKRYGIRPTLFITHNPIGVFQVYDQKN